MPLHREKYRQAILYFLHTCNNEHLGRVKLMKLLYYVDFDHFEKHRSSVTGDRYRHLEHGPVPVYADRVLNELVRDGVIAEGRTSRGPYQQHTFTPKAKYDLSVFSEAELAVLKSVESRWKTASMRAIVDATHKELPWLATPDNGDVSYIHAFRRTPKQPITPAEREAMIRSAITSNALEGVDVSYEEAAAIFDDLGLPTAPQ